jgi:hypothetical protein
MERKKLYLQCVQIEKNSITCMQYVQIKFKTTKNSYKPTGTDGGS